MNYEEAWNELRGWIEACGGTMDGWAVLGEMDFMEKQAGNQLRQCVKCTGLKPRQEVNAWGICIQCVTGG